jgi:hypothetical protein
MKLKMKNTAQHVIQLTEIFFLPDQFAILQTHLDYIVFAVWDKTVLFIGSGVSHIM